MDRETFGAAIAYAKQHGGGGQGTSNYSDLDNKPQINGVELIGNKSPEDLQLPDTKPVLTKNLTTSIALGGVAAGTTFTKDTNLEDVIDALVNPVLYPSFTAPSANISATGAKLLETGATLDTVMTITFNRGTINPAYGTDGYRAGVAEGYKLNNGEVQSGNTFNVRVSSAQLTYKGTVNYAQGEQPKDSRGNDYDNPLPSGSINTNTITYEFVDALWANTGSIGTISKQSLVSKSTKLKRFDFPAQTVANPEVFDVPASWTITAVEVLNTLSNQWEDCSGEFNVTDTVHTDASGAEVAYKRYTDNRGYNAGARSVRIKWS